MQFALAIKDKKISIPADWKEFIKKRDFFDYNGGSLGINSSVFLYPSDNIVIIVLLNTMIEGTESWTIAKRIYNDILTFK